jgi:hypothetical protein
MQQQGAAGRSRLSHGGAYNVVDNMLDDVLGGKVATVAVSDHPKVHRVDAHSRSPHQIPVLSLERPLEASHM